MHMLAYPKVGDQIVTKSHVVIQNPIADAANKKNEESSECIEEMSEKSGQKDPLSDEN